MPLLDHFNPPLSQRRQWESFHSAWAEAIALHLNQSLLPPRYFAESNVKIGTHIAADVGTLTEPEGGVGVSGGVATWAPPQPVVTAPLNFGSLDLFEVRISSDEEGPRVVAAVELVSPSNKDRPAHRQMFAVKCASYLQADIGLLIVDVVTERSGNLHAELLRLLGVTAATPAQDDSDLYASAYRTRGTDEQLQLQMWIESLGLSAPLPTMPLWIGPGLCVPLSLEETYRAACAARRIP